MANTKISQLTENTNPTGGEELVYAYNNANGKMSLNTMKTFVQNNLSGYATTSDLTTGLAGKQDTLASGTNIKTINGSSVLGSGNLDISGGVAYTAGAGIDITGGVISATGGAGGGGYDCVVAADGTGDYTTIGAAVAAGKSSIFVRNGNYTESTGWNATGNKLSILGETRGGVNITIPNTATPATGTKFIGLTDALGYFYMKNISINISFVSALRSFFNNITKGFKVEDCDFVYDSTYNGASLFNTESTITITKYDSVGIVSNNPQCGIYGCTFYTETDDTYVIYISKGDMYFERCNFNTGALSGEIAFFSDDYVFNMCNIAGLALCQQSASYYNSIVDITNNVKQYSGTSKFGINCLNGTRFNVPTATAPSSKIEVGNMINSLLYAGSLNVVAGGALSRDRIGVDCSYISAGTLVITSAVNSKFACSTCVVSGSYGVTTGNKFYTASTGTITLSGDYTVFACNTGAGFTLTDSGTGNVKDNNIFS